MKSNMKNVAFILFSLCLFSPITTPLLAQTPKQSHLVSSCQWQEAEKLQMYLTKKYGNEQPFSLYLATIYYLLMLHQQLHEEWSKTNKKELLTLIAYTENIITQLEQISRELLQILEKEVTPLSQNTPQNTEKVDTSLHNHDALLVRFVTILTEAQKHLKDYASYITPQNPQPCPQDQNNPQIPSQEPYQFPPNVPWQTQQGQQRSSTIFTYIALGVVGAGILYWIFDNYFRGTLEKQIANLGSRVTNDMKRVEILAQELEALNKRAEAIQTSLKDQNQLVTRQLAGDIDHIRTLITQYCKDLDSKIKAQLSDLFQMLKSIQEDQANLKKNLKPTEQLLQNLKKDKKQSENLLKNKDEIIGQITKLEQLQEQLVQMLGKIAIPPEGEKEEEKKDNDHTDSKTKSTLFSNLSDIQKQLIAGAAIITGSIVTLMLLYKTLRSEWFAKLWYDKWGHYKQLPRTSKELKALIEKLQILKANLQLGRINQQQYEQKKYALLRVYHPNDREKLELLCTNKPICLNGKQSLTIQAA